MKTVKSTEHHQKVRRTSLPSRQRRNADRPLALVLAARDPIDKYATPFTGIERSAIAYAPALDRALCELRPAQVGALGPQAAAVAAQLVQAGHDAAVITLPGGMDARPRKPTRSDRRWQALVAVDCLEHVQDPARFLERLKPLLAPEGRLLVVVPNITHASVRLSMLLGRYPATHNGHANGAGRSLSAPGVEQLLNNSGFLVSGIERQVDARETLEELAHGLPEGVLSVLANDLDALTSHFVFIAQPIGPSVLGALQRRVRQVADAQDVASRGAHRLNERLGELERLAPTSGRHHELERTQQRIIDLDESLRQSADEQRAAVASEFRRLDAQTRARNDSLHAARETLLARAAEIRALTAQLERSQYRGVIARLRAMVNGTVPKGAKVLVISRGDEELVKFDQRPGWHFPQAESGVYAGHHPANSRAAITHLEALRRRGARYLVMPRTAFWWLNHYGEFAQHLRTRYRCLVNHESTGMLFVLETKRE